MEPKFRCGTRKAIDELAIELNLENTMEMQDWEYEVSNPDDIELYISHYGILDDDDKKFVLMEIIIQAVTDQSDEAKFITYWEIIEPILKENFSIHEYSIFYWCCWDNENINDCWDITPYMRKLWKRET